MHAEKCARGEVASVQVEISPAKLPFFHLPTYYMLA